MSSKIKNIIIENGTIGKFKPLPFNLNQLEKAIEKISYSGERLKKDKLVENSKLPPFIIPFYEFLYDNEKLPSEVEFTNAYVTRYFDINADGKLSIKENYRNKGYSNQYFSIQGLTARLLRSYPSLIRDIHFYMLCYQSKIFDEVFYDLKSDWLHGYDLIVKFSDQKFYVKLHIDSKRGNSFEKKKHNRHDYESNLQKTINLSINPKERNLCGQIYLYDKSALNQLIDIIKDH